MLLVAAGIFAFYLISGLFNSMDFANMGAYGFSPYYGLLALLGFLIKLLMIVLIVSVAIALAQYIKDQVLDAKVWENEEEEITYEELSQFPTSQYANPDKRTLT